MSLLIEMFLLITLAGLIGGFIGWLLHGSCDKTNAHIENTEEELQS